MSVIPLTIFFSLLLACAFILLFARERAHLPLGGSERDSLMPLGDEKPRVVDSPKANPPVGHRDDDAHDHDHQHGDACGCRDGSRPPCVGCLKHLAPAPRPGARSIFSS